MSIEATLAEIENHSAYGLACSGYADVGSPDSTDSEGAKFLKDVRDVVIGAIRSLPEVTPDALEELRDSDDLRYALEGCVPIYTHRVWTVFTDLALYHEDVDEIPGSGNLTDVAMALIGAIAERLAFTIIEEVAETGDVESE